MKTFEELKEDLLERAKKHHACQDGYSMGLNAKSKQDLLKAITDNWYWVLSTSKMIDANYLEKNSMRHVHSHRVFHHLDK